LPIRSAPICYFQTFDTAFGQAIRTAKSPSARRPNPATAPEQHDYRGFTGFPAPFVTVTMIVRRVPVAALIRAKWLPMRLVIEGLSAKYAMAAPQASRAMPIFRVHG
jgi:hypothetical protein